MTRASAEIAILNFFYWQDPFFTMQNFMRPYFTFLVSFQNPDKFCLLNNVWFFLCKIWIMTVPNQLFLLMYNNRLRWNQYLNTCPIHSSFHPGISISNFWGSQPPFSKLIHTLTHSLTHSLTHTLAWVFTLSTGGFSLSFLPSHRILSEVPPRGDLPGLCSLLNRCGLKLFKCDAKMCKYMPL